MQKATSFQQILFLSTLAEVFWQTGPLGGVARTDSHLGRDTRGPAPVMGRSSGGRRRPPEHGLSLMVFRCWEGLRVREGLDVTPQHRIWAGSWSRETDFSLQYCRFPAARPVRPRPLQAPHHSCAAPAGQHCAQSHLILSLSQLIFFRVKYA